MIHISSSSFLHLISQNLYLRAVAVCFLPSAVLLINSSIPFHPNTHNSAQGSVTDSDSWQVSRGDECFLMATKPAAVRVERWTKDEQRTKDDREKLCARRRERKTATWSKNTQIHTITQISILILVISYFYTACNTDTQMMLINCVCVMSSTALQV